MHVLIVEDDDAIADALTKGLEREGLREADLLRMFDELRWADRLDASATAMLDRTWV